MSAPACCAWRLLAGAALDIVFLSAIVWTCSQRTRPRSPGAVLTRLPCDWSAADMSAQTLRRRERGVVGKALAGPGVPLTGTRRTPK